MELLAKLYDCVDQSMAGHSADWEAFASEFKDITEADMLLYRIAFPATETTAKAVEIICSSNEPLIRDYVDRRLFEAHPVSETSLAPLEPARRTDIMTDDKFRQLGPLSDFMIPNGMFYLMMVPSVMPDGSYLCLYVWRGENDTDFSDMEKQRLALIMRHLLAILECKKLVPGFPNTEMIAFSEKYGLTPTETELLSALIEGYSLRAIAAETGRTYGTVRWHVQNILEKCQARTQRSLLSEFYRLVPLPQKTDV